MGDKLTTPSIQGQGKECVELYISLYACMVCTGTNLHFLSLTFRVAARFRTMESFVENVVRPKRFLMQHLYSVRPEFKVPQKRSAFSIFGSETWTYAHPPPIH